jgi:hypothetical protein
MKYVLTAALLASVISAAPAYASGCVGGDHVHSAQDIAAKHFDQMDANGDEIVTKQEFENSPMAKSLKSFEVLKPNETGVVTKGAFIESFIKAHPQMQKEA